MNTTTCTHKDNPNFWIFGLFFFLYFFIMATCFPFLPIWLSDIIGLNKTHTGIVSPASRCRPSPSSRCWGSFRTSLG
jgi:LacY proton/sugar symporter.